MEKCGNLGGPAEPSRRAFSACSACAGDYEDPERSAWPDHDLNEPIDDDDQGDATSPEVKTTIERNSNAEEAIDQVAGRRNEDENEKHHHA